MQFFVSLLILIPFITNYSGSCHSVIEPQTFNEITKSKSFIDKTLFLAKLMDLPYRAYITAPSGFGKSTMLTMIKSFFETSFDEDGIPKSADSSPSYGIFQPLKIFGEKKFFRQNFGKYPVIFLSLETVFSNNTTPFLESMSAVIRKACSPFDYLKYSPNLNENQKEELKSFSKNGSLLTEFDVQNSVKKLCEWIFIHSQQYCIVLVDEFDAPIHSILKNSVGPPSIDHECQILRLFVANTFKFNRYLKRGVLTGRIRIKESSRVLANTIDHMHFSDLRVLALHYGFTSDDVRTLGCRYKKTEKEMDEMRKWYDGYTDRGDTLRVYNMQSVLTSLNTNKVGPFWKEPEQLKGLEYIFYHENAGEQIIKSLEHPLPFCIRGTISYEVVERVQTLNNRCYIYLQFLQDCGFYSVVGKPGEEARSAIPNLEVKIALEKALYDSWIYKFSIQDSDRNKFLKSFDHLDKDKSSVELFLKEFKNLFQHSSSYPVDKIEFSGLIYLILKRHPRIFVKRDYAISKEREIDLLIVKNSTSEKESGVIQKTGIIIAFNYENKTQELAHDALLKILHPSRACYDVFSEKEVLKRGPISETLFMGLSCRRNVTSCEISYLYNSTNIDDEILIKV